MEHVTRWKKKSKSTLTRNYVVYWFWIEWLPELVVDIHKYRVSYFFVSSGEMYACNTFVFYLMQYFKGLFTQD